MTTPWLPSNCRLGVAARQRIQLRHSFHMATTPGDADVLACAAEIPVFADDDGLQVCGEAWLAKINSRPIFGLNDIDDSIVVPAHRFGWRSGGRRR